MKINKKQLPMRLIEVVQKQKYKSDFGPEVRNLKKIPIGEDFLTTEQSNIWYNVDDVICVFIDMKSSTKLSKFWESIYTRHEMTKVYTLFTGTATRFLHLLGASYIDIKGDGVFGLFNSDQPHRALAAAVSFKTFADTIFYHDVVKVVKNDVSTGARIGIHQSSLLASKIGLRKNSNRTNKHNEVWIGDAVNFSSKLSGLSNEGEIHISEKFFKKITEESALRSCGCDTGLLGSSKRGHDVWKEVKLPKKERDLLGRVYKTEYCFCVKHGESTYRALINADADSAFSPSTADAV